MGERERAREREREREREGEREAAPFCFPLRWRSFLFFCILFFAGEALGFVSFVCFFSLKEEEKREREREDAIMPLPEGGVGGKECGGVVSEHRNGNGNVNGPVDQQTTPRSQAR